MDSNRVIGLENSFYKVYKVFLVLLLQVIIYKLKMSIFKNFKTNIIVNVVCRYNINSLSSLLLTFANLLTDVCYTV